MFDQVERILVEVYGNRAQAGSRSINIVFDDDGFGVDVVPAVRSGERWAIPEKDRNLWIAESAGERWRDTDPEKFADLTEARNERPLVNGRGAYVPTVKLIRQTRRHHLGDSNPPGLYFEVMTYWAFESVSGDSFAEFFSQALESIVQQLDGIASSPIIDPALDEPLEPQPEQPDGDRARAVFQDLAGKARQALELDKCPAAILWREILGSNELGDCFPLPAGCDEEGKELERVEVNVSPGSREARGYGSTS